MNNDSQQKPLTESRHDHAVLILGMVAAGNMDVECAYDALVSMLATSPAAIQRGDGQTELDFVELAKAEALYIRWRGGEDLQDSLAHALGWATRQLRNQSATTPPAANPNETSGATPERHYMCAKSHGWITNGASCALCQHEEIALLKVERDSAVRELAAARATSTK